MADLRTVLINRLEMAWQTIDFTVADLTDEQLHQHREGAQIGTPASIYLHVSWVEDMVVNQMLQGNDTVYNRQGWAEKMPDAPVHLGPSTLEWAVSVHLPAAATAMEYAAAVRGDVREYIANLSDEDLDRLVPWFVGEVPLAEVLSYFVWDVANHTGEIAAMRGLAGMKGLPF
jgi:uncharacterized damage-inducible protein DinB